MRIEHLAEMLGVLERERGIAKEILLDAVKASLVSACKKKLNTNDNLEAEIDAEGNVKIFCKKVIVEDTVEDPTTQISQAEAKKKGCKAAPGETFSVEVTPQDFGRLAAQTAKQVIIQRIREAEKEGAFEEFNKKTGEIITGLVQRRERGGYLVNLGKVETFLPASETIPREIFHPKERIKLYVVEIKKTSKGPLVVVSRTHPNLVVKLFELEVPEISQHILEIKAIAREAGRRTKIAVLSKDSNVAAVGTCVGQMGARIQNIVRELGNEKVDIIEWSEDAKKLISNALSPAKIVSVKLNKESQSATVVVPEDQLSLAIGKEGQNVRLAAKLTGWKIDIINEKEAEAETAPKKKTAVPTEEKTKVHELAKALTLTSKEILAKAKELGIEAKAATSSLTKEEVEKLKSALSSAENAADETNKPTKEEETT